MEPEEWVWGDPDGDDDETYPPQFNEPEWSSAMEGEEEGEE